jgi:hypothetical protein
MILFLFKIIFFFFYLLEIFFRRNFYEFILIRILFFFFGDICLHRLKFLIDRKRGFYRLL